METVTDTCKRIDMHDKSRARVRRPAGGPGLEFYFYNRAGPQLWRAGPTSVGPPKPVQSKNGMSFNVQFLNTK